MPSYRGELGLPNQHPIATTRQGAADSNEALPRHGRGGAHAEAWRGDGGRVRFVQRRPHRRRRAWLSRGRESTVFQIGALRRALVAYACCGVSQAFGQPFRAFVCADRRWAPRRWRFGGVSFCLVGLSTFLSTGIGGFRSAFDLYLELRRQGGVPGHSDIPPAEPDVARSDTVE